MSESGFDDVIALAATCLDDAERTHRRAPPQMKDDAYVYAIRMQSLYMGICTLAAEHGNPSAQRILSMVGKHLASLAGPHGAPDIERDEQ